MISDVPVANNLTFGWSAPLVILFLKDICVPHCFRPFGGVLDLWTPLALAHSTCSFFFPLFTTCILALEIPGDLGMVVFGECKLVTVG